MKLKLLSFIILFVFAGNIISNAQDNITVSGNISSSTDNFPLPGASVLIKGTSTGVITDFDGNYEITVSGDNPTLLYSFQGFKTKEVNIGTQSTINVTLDEDVSNLDEIVLIGYGSSRRKDLTGSISSIKTEDIENVKVTSPDEILQGRVAGLVLTQTSGQPGGSSSIRIRGSSSINAGNEPLYVIDGFPINSNNNDVSSGVTEGPTMNALSSISPSDIESIDVLKDASATAIYGSRGANGVIIIKTKRGFNGDAKVSFNSYVGFQTVNKTINLLNGSQFAHYINEANYNAGLPRTYANPVTFGEGTNWQNELFRDAIITNHDLSFRGGTDKIKYSVTASYLDQEGVIQETDFNRTNFRVNLDFKVNDKLSIENTLGITRSNFNTSNTEGGLGFGRGSSVATAYVFSPLLPVFDSNGNYTKANFVVNADGTFNNSQDNANFQSGTPLINPLASLNLNESIGRTTRILENFAFKYKITPKLNFKTSIGVDLILNEESIFRTAEIDFTSERAAAAVKAKQLSSNWITESTLNYSNTFNNKHTLNTFIGFSAQEFETDILNALVLGFPIENFGSDNIGLGIDQSAGSDIIRKSFLSYFGRANYSLNNKYIFTLTGRYDGASVFGPNTKYGFFPSGAFAWNMYDEEFIQNWNVFSHLKLRLGYGEVGNSDITPNSALSRYRDSFHYFGNTPAQGFLPISPANSDLAWERTKQFNVGLDMNFFDDRIGINLDIYNKKTDDLLLLLPTPINTGYSAVMVNAGDVKNTGFEIALNTNNFTGKFNWKTNLTFSYNKNEIVSLAGLDQIPTGFGINGISEWQLLVVGGEIGAFYGYQSNGIAQLNDDVSNIPHFTTETLVAGERMYKDLNGDGIITDKDKTFIGNPLPEYSFGISNTFDYKNFDLNLFFQGVMGNEIVNFNRYNLEGLDGRSNVTLNAFSNRWTPENPSNKYTRAVTGGRSNVFSDHFVEEGDYLRLKFVTLGYTLPSTFLSKMSMDKMRFYVTGKNLLTLSNYSGVDPEVSVGGQNNNLSAGGDYGSYPSTRTVLFGVNFNF